MAAAEISSVHARIINRVRRKTVLLNWGPPHKHERWLCHYGPGRCSPVGIRKIRHFVSLSATVAPAQNNHGGCADIVLRGVQPLQSGGIRRASLRRAALSADT